MTDKVFTLGSLFSGIGGLELGLEMTGRFKTVFQVEQSDFCRKVLRKHWPEALQFEDVRNVGKGNLPAVDVICGGFPCQDVSNSGTRAGIAEGTRSGLWHEYARIIREVRPRFVVVENVSALLARGLDIVLGELSESGYDAEWSMLSAEAVGAPHLRERVFVVAYPASVNDSRRRHTRADKRNAERNASIPRRRSNDVAYANGERARSDSETLHPRQPELGGISAEIPDSTRLGWEQGNTHAGRSRPRIGTWEEHRPVNGGGWWSTEPDVGRVANGIPDRVDRLSALGNAVVPQCARVIGEWLLEIDAELQAVA